MAKRLIDNITTDYLGAAQRLKPKSGRKKIVAYVESYDDVMFWRMLLSEIETDKYYFEVMLPSRTSLSKGKKCALMNTLGRGLGVNMIACVDADYDYLMQGSTDISRMICMNPYVFHTYAYAIESFQCYAPSLHDVCVMATLNDHSIFDFEGFFAAYSRIVFPLFVWSVWCYRTGFHNLFSMADMCQTIQLDDFRMERAESVLSKISRRVNVKIAQLQHRFPQARGAYQHLRDELLKLGITPETTYLYMRGHDVFERVACPIVDEVCNRLRREREREIRRLAAHDTQCMNELAGYQHSSAQPVEMLRKHSGYRNAPLYRRIVSDLRFFLEHIEEDRPNEPVLSLEYCVGKNHRKNFRGKPS